MKKSFDLQLILKNAIYISSVGSISALGNSEEEVWENYLSHSHSFISKNNAFLAPLKISQEKEIDNLDLSLENLETIQLKKPNQVYFELYKEARKKAKEAKRTTIIAYLEAKNIKKTYMLDNLNDSDSEFDAEIDEVSESELDDF